MKYSTSLHDTSLQGTPTFLCAERTCPMASSAMKIQFLWDVTLSALVIAAFRRIVAYSSSGSSSPRRIIFRQHNTEDEGYTMLRDKRNCSADITASHFRRNASSAAQLCKSQIFTVLLILLQLWVTGYKITCTWQRECKCSCQCLIQKYNTIECIRFIEWRYSCMHLGTFA